MRNEFCAKERICLDSSALTLLSKTMESDGLITSARLPEDDRSLIITITEKGELKEKAAKISVLMMTYTNLSHENVKSLFELLYNILEQALCFLK